MEVHGGASLEEVVVPIITLSLRDNSIVIKLVEPTVKADYKTGTAITLYVNKAIAQPLSVEYKGKRYSGIAIDGNHYKVEIPDIKRAGTVPADVYLGEDLVTDFLTFVAMNSFPVIASIILSISSFDLTVLSLPRFSVALNVSVEPSVFFKIT